MSDVNKQEISDTPTPRTDEQEFHECGGYEVEWPTFARTLELELSAANAAHDEETCKANAAIQALEHGLAEARFRVSELERDRERLDWLEAHPDGLRTCYHVASMVGPVFTFDQSQRVGECPKTLRSAIDAAADAAKDQEK